MKNLLIILLRFDIEGYVTGFGNPDWARTHDVASRTSPVVSSLVEGGAICIGKTVVDEMAYRFVPARLTSLVGLSSMLSDVSLYFFVSPSFCCIILELSAVVDIFFLQKKKKKMFVFCMYSINGENKHYDTPTNPAAPSRIPGGSSSGAAVAVAANLVDFSLGGFLFIFLMFSLSSYFSLSSFSTYLVLINIVFALTAIVYENSFC